VISMMVKPKEPEKLIARLKDKPLVLYGFGGAGKSIASWCGENGINYIFADRDAAQKQKDTNKPVISPEILAKEYFNANVVISSIVYYDEIAESLRALGIQNILSYQMFMPEKVTWKDLEHSTVWGTHMGRVKLIASWIPADAHSIADYGAGKLSLKQFLEPDTTYYPIDYTSRSKDTIVCNFDKDEFPELRTEVAICTATLVFINNADRLLAHICSHTSHTIILSYVTWERFQDTAGRRASGYVNDFTQAQLLSKLYDQSFILKETLPDPANNLDTMYLFYKK